MSIIVLSVPKPNRNPNDDMKRTRRILGYVATDCSCRVIILGIETQLLGLGGGGGRGSPTRYNNDQKL